MGNDSDTDEPVVDMEIEGVSIDNEGEEVLDNNTDVFQDVMEVIPPPVTEEPEAIGIM